MTNDRYTGQGEDISSAVHDCLRKSNGVYRAPICVIEGENHSFTAVPIEYRDSKMDRAIAVLATLYQEKQAEKRDTL